jgi:hypothetical protein
VGDDVHLGVVEERVLVQIRRAEGHPAVVDDGNLGVDVDRVGTGARAGAERAGEDASVVAVCVDQLGEDAAGIVVAALRAGRQHHQHPKTWRRWVDELFSE